MMQDIRNNPLRTREDVERAAIQLLEPLISKLSPGSARLRLPGSGAAYAPSVVEVEAFARPLWAIIPLLASGSELIQPIWLRWREGIIHGTDPKHPEYWGEAGDCDQRMVEMAVFGFGMAIASDTFYYALPESAQRNLYRWLNQINEREVPKNNWAFFRILVNVGFICCGLKHSERRMQEDLALIEAHYEDHGWYFDSPTQRDYYSIWEFHFDGLIYACAMMQHNPEQSHRFLDRARQMAPAFACWFDSRGEALPYGRSLTYRFAQSAAFSAMAFAGVEAPSVSHGVQKHLLLNNLRSWLKKPILTSEGVLSVGYGYPNILMAEGYNAPGSPYWGMKAFLCLALPEAHPFWQVEEQAFDAPALSLQPHARLLISRSADGSHVMGYEAGNLARGHSHGEAKYEKFVYSTLFGFSVPKGRFGLAAGAYDSMLAVSADGFSWYPRASLDSYELLPDRLHFVWQPLEGVRIQTTIIPEGEWHLRIHEIETTRAIQLAEGGYAMPRGEKAEERPQVEGGLACLSAPWGISLIRALEGYQSAELLAVEPNTNLMAPRTLLPTLRGELTPGKHRLVCAVLGSADAGVSQALPEGCRQHLKEYRT